MPFAVRCSDLLERIESLSQFLLRRSALLRESLKFCQIYGLAWLRVLLNMHHELFRIQINPDAP